MKQHFRVSTSPCPNPQNVVLGETYRITLLTDRLIRFEYAADGVFLDEPTQTVWNRDFGVVPYTLRRTGDGILLRTQCLTIHYDEKPFSPNGLSVDLHSGSASGHGDWHYGDVCRDLKGTARTLDAVDGDQVELGHGIVSRDGFAILDDSGSLILREDGWFAPRNIAGQDLYFFGYGHAYQEALQDFYRLCGPTPMLPRFALGNWWSRYYRYSQAEYLQLMDRFRQEGIPFSVAVIDMDWHLVDIDPKYGGGWTGFTWNRELFPDPEAFLSELHRRGMRVTLNLHPADGVRAYEAAYPVLADHMGIDPTTEAPIPFDPTDPVFLQHYYADVLNPMEDEGVDFWWVDWQQGTQTKIPGMDPLWVLNHYDFLDSGRNGKRPLTFSRYAGPGSHRYPIGFSGDTIVTWASLRFQPYFTATASNIGYGWWSHDIGGHMQGYKDDELMARWTQLGTFSPILRLHSSCSPFHGKEPWRYSPETRQTMNRFLRLRHQLVPYLYTMNRRSYAQGIPLVLPLYYSEPENPLAYTHDTQYWFGSSLLVQPITSPRIPRLKVAKETLYLPEGLWYDFLTERAYRGGRELTVYRSLEEMPVFARAGTILPMTEEIGAEAVAANPQCLRLQVYLGQNGSFVLYEDDGSTTRYTEGEFATTRMVLEELEHTVRFTVFPAEGHPELLPPFRDYEIRLVGCRSDMGELSVAIDGQPVSGSFVREQAGHTAVLSLQGISPTSVLEISLPKEAVRPHNDTVGAVYDFLDQAELAFACKDQIFRIVQKKADVGFILSELLALSLEPDLYGVLAEILTAL